MPHDADNPIYRELEQEHKRTYELLHVVIPIGVALSTEQDFDRLLERIILEARSFCNADGGTLYLRTPDDHLKFVVMSNASLNIALSSAGGQASPFSPLPMYDATTGEPNNRNVACYVALSGASAGIADVYQAEGFNFSGAMDFDRETGYRTQSCLAIPLKNCFGRVLGVLQLINAQDPATGQVIPFDPYLQELMESFSLLAAAALEAYSREKDLKDQIERLRIEIDEVKRQRLVSEIVDTDFFRDLQAKADAVRLGRRQRLARSDQPPEN
jgi:GAF domain-containing protein